MNEEYPYPECATCKSLLDCKHVEVQRDGLGTPLPPQLCPRPMDILKESFKRKKRNDRTIPEVYPNNPE
jgi:hypothetical protein